MDFSKTIYSLVGVLVAVIMIATVAMPAITSASTTIITSTTTETHDVEVSDPIYYRPYFDTLSIHFNGNFPVINYDSSTNGYVLDDDFTSIPLAISETMVCILYKNGSAYSAVATGLDRYGNTEMVSATFDLDTNHFLRFAFTANNSFDAVFYTAGSNSVESKIQCIEPTWSYLLTSPDYGRVYDGSYITSASQEVVSLGSLDEVIAGSAFNSGSNMGFAFFHDGNQTQYGDYALDINSVQTNSGVEVSLRAAYNGADVLILVPTVTEVTIIETTTVPSEYAPILNVVLLILLIVPVTAVAAMLYFRRD
jgi:hypothetical protein